MAEHLAFTAIRALRDVLVAANTRAGANVEIGRASNIGDPELENDAIDVNVGTDSPTSELGTDNLYRIESIQRVYVDLHTRTAGVEHEETVVAQVFELRAQTHAAILADHTLGQSHVVSVRYLGTEDFDPESGGDRLGSMRTVWDVAYLMRYADPTSVA